MMQARDSSGKILAIGFQYIASPSIQRIKKLTLAKSLGALISAKSYAGLPRTDQYFRRNYWSGKLCVNGKPIYDSPIQNATAHFLNNMLYIAGESKHESAVPREIYGENYRANDIDSPDTQFIRVITTNRIMITFFASHAVGTVIDPKMELSYERGKVIWHRNGQTEVLHKKNSEYTVREEFADGDVSIRDELFRDVIDSVRENRRPLVDIDNSWQHTACVEKLFETGEIVTIDNKYLETLEVEKQFYKSMDTKASEKPQLTVIKGLESLMESMYVEENSFYEQGVPWAVRCQTKYLP
jgi:predicted dehydrogenase